MLGETAEDLAAGGQRMVLAHDVGQVRDVLRAGGDGELEVYATIAEAVAALSAAGSDPSAPVSGDQAPG